MAVTIPIFTKFVFSRQNFVQNCNVIFHENPTRYLIAYKTSQADGHDLCIVKERPVVEMYRYVRILP